MRAKYIIIEQDGFEMPLIFSELMVHSQFANLNIKSAGFVSFRDNMAYCFGESVTLKMKSRPQDSDIIQKRIIGISELA